MAAEDFPPLEVCEVSALKRPHLKYASKFVPSITKGRGKIKTARGQYHTCYCIINIKNKKCYFGKHTFDYNPENVGYSTNYWGSSTWLKRSMRKYGMHNFRMIILKYFSSSEAALLHEEKLITSEMVISKRCYNRQGGGKGWASGDKHHIHEKVKHGTCPLQKRPDGTGGGGVNNVGVPPWENSFATDKSKITWLLSDIIYRISELHKGYTHIQLLNRIGRILGIELSYSTDVLAHFKANPVLDPAWTEFRSMNPMLVEPLLKKKEKLLRAFGSSDFIDSSNEQPAWSNPRSTEESKFTWSMAHKVYRIWKKNPKFGRRRMNQACMDSFDLVAENLSSQALDTLLHKFRRGYIPKKDPEWLLFKHEMVYHGQAKEAPDNHDRIPGKRRFRSGKTRIPYLLVVFS